MQNDFENIGCNCIQSIKYIINDRRLLMTDDPNKQKTIAGKVYKTLLETPTKFAYFTGMELAEFQNLIKNLKPSWDKIQSKKKCHGRASKIATLEKRLMVLLLRY